MKVLGYDVDETTGMSPCGTVRVSMPGQRLTPAHRWGDGLSKTWSIWVIMGRAEIRAQWFGTLQGAEADALKQLNEVHAMASAAIAKARSRAPNVDAPPPLSPEERGLALADKQ